MMQSRVCFFILLLSTTIQYASDLNSLLQQMGSSNDQANSSSSSETQTNIDEEQSSNLNAALSQVVPDTTDTAAVSGNSVLLKQFITAQSNPEYQSAMKILSNKELQQTYNEGMLGIQMFFLKYRSNELDNLSSQETVAHGVTLVDALHSVAAATSSTTGSSPEGISSLLQGLQVNDQTQGQKTVENSVMSYLQTVSSVASSAHKPTSEESGFNNLLSALHGSSVVVSKSNQSTDSFNNLSADLEDMTSSPQASQNANITAN